MAKRTPERVANAKRLRAEGRSWAEVADLVSKGGKPVSEAAVRQWLKAEAALPAPVAVPDSRPAAAGKATQEKHPDWHAIPLEEIAARISEVPKDRPVAIICNTGLRAYDSLLVLARNGVTNVVNSTGGMQAVIKMGLSL